MIPISEREAMRKDMVNVALDTLSAEVRSMLLNEGGTKAIVYVSQPYMNLNVAGNCAMKSMRFWKKVLRC